MCGIAGVCMPRDVEAAASHVAEALQDLKHRGPDGRGMFVESALILGMRRLAVIDLVTGGQPVFSEDRNVVAVLNGEIYNYLELRDGLRQRGHTLATRSDTEVLVHLWEDEGAALCAKLRGMFAFAIWDRKARTLLLVRSRCTFLGCRDAAWRSPRS